jgi:hypothetical protein
MVHDAVVVPTVSCTVGVIVTVLVYVTKAKLTEPKQTAKQIMQTMPLMPSEPRSFRALSLFDISRHFIPKIGLDKRFMKGKYIFEILNLVAKLSIKLSQKLESQVPAFLPVKTPPKAKNPKDAPNR